MRIDGEGYTPGVRRLFSLAKRVAPWLVLGLLAFTMLWRGGKSLEATWLLSIVAVWVTFSGWGSHTKKTKDGGVPLLLWGSLAAFLVWTGLAFGYSLTRNYGLDELLRDSSFVLIFLWLVRMEARAKSRFGSHLVSVIAMAALLACVIGAIVYVLQPVDRFVGSFFDARFHTDYWPNAWADLLLLAWPVTLLWTRSFRWPLRVLVLGIELGALFLSYSRGGFLALIAQVLLLCVAMLWMQRRSLVALVPRILGESIAIVALGALMFVSFNAARTPFHPVQSLEQKVTFTAAEGRSSVDERRQFWSQALQMAKDRPLLGWGPYSFRFVQPRYQQHVLATSDHPHNVFLKLAAERGWPTLMFFALVLLCVFVPSLIRLLRRQAGYGESLFLVAAVGVLLHSQIDFNLQFVGVSLMFWLLLGLLVHPRVRVPHRHAAFVWRSELLLAMLIGVIAISEGRYLLLSSFGRHAEAQGNVQEALQWYGEARPEQFSRDLHLSRANLYVSESNVAAAASALDDYQAQNPEDARAWVLRGVLAEGEGKFDAAVLAYSKAFTLAQYNYVEAGTGLLRTLLAAGRQSEVAAGRTHFEALFTAYHDAILRNTHFIDLSRTTMDAYTEFGQLLGRAYPDAQQTYDTQVREALAHATEEQGRLAGRSNGFLW